MEREEVTEEPLTFRGIVVMLIIALVGVMVTHRYYPDSWTHNMVDLVSADAGDNK